MAKMTIVLSKKKPLPAKEVEEDMGEESGGEMCECPECGHKYMHGAEED